MVLSLSYHCCISIQQAVQYKLATKVEATIQEAEKVQRHHDESTESLQCVPLQGNVIPALQACDDEEEPGTHRTWGRIECPKCFQTGCMLESKDIDIFSFVSIVCFVNR
uniref:Uncharacterized protein n=1 Tax=Oryza sativa subsp. japonica TaxID=39947 RepID=Q651N2_ORYSJ|nr:hypothetical protein [Oryza sativa Japonica Group]